MHNSISSYLIALLDHSVADTNMVVRIFANSVGDPLLECWDPIGEEPRRHTNARAAERC